jgi:hypothetical protein
VEFTFTAAFRRSGYGGTGPGGFAGIGDLITEFIGATGLDYGDGGSTGILNFRVTAIDPVADWLVGVAVNPANNSQLTIPHTYAAAATFTAFVSGCCRIGALQNSAGGSYRVETRVDFSGNTSPLSSLTPIVLVPDNLTYSFALPAGDVDPDSVLSYRMATVAESTSTQPPTVSVDPTTGVVTFDTRDIVIATIPGHLWTTQIIIEDRDAVTNALRTKVAIDFIMQITLFVGDPPECILSPVGPYTAFAGQPFALVIDGSTTLANTTVTINSGGLPSGATTTPALPATSVANPTGGSSVSVTMNWTPTAAQAGPHPILFTVTDSFFQQHNCPLVITVVTNQPPVIKCEPVVLWSPNHFLVDVSSAVTVTDPDNNPVTVTVRMMSDEPEVPQAGDGTGRHAPDFKNEMVPGGRGLLLRSERQGPGNGRYYVAVIEADDGQGGITTHACVVAVVPHDQSKASLAAVLAEAAAAEVAIQAAIDSAAILPIPGTQEHGLASPQGPHQ